MLCHYLFQLFDVTECGNGYVETGEDCDCGFQMVILEYFYAYIAFFNSYDKLPSANHTLLTMCLRRYSEIAAAK